MHTESTRVERKKIQRILIANRGEIALRAIRTIQEMGKQAIAIHSIADKDVHYLEVADAKVCIGGAKSSESYPVSYTHLTLPTTVGPCRSRWSPYH